MQSQYLLENVPSSLALKRTQLKEKGENKPSEIKRLENIVKKLIGSEHEHDNLMKYYGWGYERIELVDYFITFSEYCDGELLTGDFQINLKLGNIRLVKIVLCYRRHFDKSRQKPRLEFTSNKALQ